MPKNKDLIIPSFSQGFAKNKLESKYPHLWDGLIGMWVPALGKQGSSKLLDLSGYGNHGTLNGSMDNSDWVVGSNGYALDLDGTNDYVDCGSSTLLRPVAAGTYIGRIRFSSLNSYRTFLSNGSMGGAESNGVNFGTEVGPFIAASLNNGLSNHQIVMGTTTLIINVWYHFATTWDSSVVNVYVNGMRDVVETAQTVIPSPSYNFTIGSDALKIGAYTPGAFGEVQVYNRALLPSEILSLYLGASPLTLKSKKTYTFGRPPTPPTPPIIINENFFSYKKVLKPVSRYKPLLSQPYGNGPFFEPPAGTGVANVVYTQNISGQSRIQISTDFSLTGQSRIENSYNYNLTGQSRIQKSTDFSITGNSRIENSYNYPITGQSRIEISNNSNLSGNSKIENSYNSNLTGNSTISNSYTYPITGNSAIERSFNSTLTGNSTINVGYNSNLTGNSRIESSYFNYLTGQSAVQSSYNSNLSGNSRIENTYSNQITGNSRIQNSYNSSLTGQSTIQNSYNNNLSGNSNIQKSFDSFISGNSRIQVSYNNCLSGNSSIGTSYGSIITGNSTINVGYNSIITGNSEIIPIPPDPAIRIIVKYGSNNLAKYVNSITNQRIGSTPNSSRTSVNIREKNM